MNWISVALAFISLFAISTANNCDVTITNGRIIGFTSSTTNPEREVCSYLGIPYAAPPVGNLRFKPPNPAPAFSGTFFATTLPNWCPQLGVAPPGVKMDEDCLQLNVYVPKTENATDLPVMVFIHGGSFTSGSSDDYNAEKILGRQDVILVVPHYRLGILGLFSTGDNSAPGNFAFKDQSFALRWVKDNIHKFGGNPDNVVIFGESAGSGSVLVQMVSPLSKGLFSGVIAQSGSILLTGFVDPEPLASATQLAKILFCPSWPTALMVTCIRTVSWQRLVLAQAMGAKSQQAVKEHWHLDGPALMDEPMEILKKGDFDKVPLIIGANKHEGSLVVGALYATMIGPLKLDKNPEFMRYRIVPEILKIFGIAEDVSNRGLSSSVEMAYLSGLNRTNWAEVSPGLVDIVTVFAFKSSTLHLANILSDRGYPVYLYSFEHHSNNSILWDDLPGPIKPHIPHGIAHGDDLLYLFDFPATFSDLDQQFSDIFIDMWTNFAKTGNPTPSPDARYPLWPTYDNEQQLFMKLNATPTVLEDYKTSWNPKSFEWS